MSISRFIRKPSIPSLNGWPEALLSVMRPTKETLEIITGRRGQKLQQLAGTVDINTVAERLNEVIRVLQDGSDTEVQVGGATTTPADPNPQVTINNLTQQVINYIISGVPTAATNVTDFILNGDMTICRRGITASTDLVQSGYLGKAMAIDRFCVANNDVQGHAKITRGVLSASSAPLFDGQPIRNYARVERGASWVGGTLASVLVAHSIDNYVVMKHLNQAFTLRFLVRSSVTGTYGVALVLPHSSGGSQRNVYVTSYQITTANTWEEKSIEVPAPSLSIQSQLPTTNNAPYGMLVQWQVRRGTSKTPNTWISDNNTFGAMVSGQADGLAGSSDYFDLTAVHTGGVRRSHESEVFETARYYQRSSADNTFSGGTIGPSDTSGTCYFGGYDDAANGKARIYIPFQVPMRAFSGFYPKVTTYAPGTTTRGRVLRLSDSAVITGFDTAATSQHGFSAEIDLNTFANQGVSLCWEADAEIFV